MESYPTGVRAFTPSPAQFPYQAPAPRPSEAPWIATPLNLREDPRIIAFTAEMLALGITTSRWLAESVAIATYHRLHAWATKHEPDGTLAGVAPVVIAGAVGWEGDPGALWASLTRAGIVDAFGAITGWASTGGRRGARLSAMTGNSIPGTPTGVRVHTTTSVYAPPKHGRRLDLTAQQRVERARWLDRVGKARRRSSRPSVRELSGNASNLSGNLPETGPNNRSDVREPRGIGDSRFIPSLNAPNGAPNHDPRYVGTVTNTTVLAWIDACAIAEPRADHVNWITIQFGDTPDASTVERFRKHCTWWLGQGWKGTSVQWLLDSWGKAGATAKTPARGAGKAGRPVQPRLLDGVRQPIARNAEARTAPPPADLPILPPAEEWRPLSPQAEGAWKETKRQYREAHGIPAYTSMDMDLVRAWDAERRAKAADAVSRPFASIPATSCEYRGRPVMTMAGAIATFVMPEEDWIR